MNNNEMIIKERHSVRKYLDKDIEDNKVDELNKLIKKCNDENDLNIQFIINEANVFDKFILHYGRIHNAKNYIALIGKKDKDLNEKLGYFGEMIVLKAQDLGLNTCWVAGTLNKKYISAKINKGEKLVCVIAIGYGETQGKNRKLRSIKQISKSINDLPDWYSKGIEYVLCAPSAMNQQRYRFELIDDNKVKAIALKGHLTDMDLGIAKYHFELGAGKDSFEWI